MILKDSPQQMSRIAHLIWDEKYRLRSMGACSSEKTVEDTWGRVAAALAASEDAPEYWTERFYNALAGFRFIPAGRILSGAGTDRDVTLANCFVMGQIDDSIDGIFAALGEAAKTIKAGGGIGYDFSTIRPKGMSIQGVEAKASGPVSFMEIWDTMCRVMQDGGVRRGAMMSALSCDHPDIEEFVTAKMDGRPLSRFNMSVLVTDRFVQAVKANEDWDLVFDGQVHRRVPAAALWDKIMRATYESAEPSVIFIDRINNRNNLSYVETIFATNPCGEQPLPPYGACILGSVNLAALVDNAFSAQAQISDAVLDAIVSRAVRMLDNAIDSSWFPLDAQMQEAMAKRRIGLGITGLADALAMCGVRYGGQDALDLMDRWLERIVVAAYRTSAHLAEEKGAFPLFDLSAYTDSPLFQRLPAAVRDLIQTHGLRNGLMTSIAPTGTISLFAGNVSSGIEPIFSLEYKRDIRGEDGNTRTELIMDYAVAEYRKLYGDAPLPPFFVTADDLNTTDHVRTLAAAQNWIDSAISKTINIASDCAFSEFQDVYLDAYDLGCKGCTTYRPNAYVGAVMTKPEAQDQDAARDTGSLGKETDTDPPLICYDCG